MRTTAKVLALFFVFCALVSYASAQEIPHLFTSSSQVFNKGTLTSSERVLSMEQVTLDAEVLGFSAFSLNVEGREFVAERVDSERRIASETFTYRVVGEELPSTFTKSYNGIVFGHIWANGKSYFVSGEGDQYLVTSSLYVPMPEVVHYPLLMQPITLSTNSAGLGRRRAVRSGPGPTSVSVVVAVCADYRDKVGGTEKAIARVTHMIDRQNNAYRASGFNGRMDLKEIAFVDPPQEVIELGLYAWSINPEGPVAEIRRRNKAAATMVFSQGALRSEATRTSPSAINPNIEVAIVARFFAEWDDGDIKSALHEIGHLSGGDHNYQHAPPQTQDPQASARDWYSCEEGVYGALSYNVCDRWLERIEMYSGLNAVYGGKARGSEMQNNVGTFEKVFQFLKGDHD